MGTTKKERVVSAGRAHLNATISSEAMREVRIFALDTNRTLGAAVDWCIRDSIHAWKNDQQDEAQLEKDNA